MRSFSYILNSVVARAGVFSSMVTSVLTALVWYWAIHSIVVNIPADHSPLCDVMHGLNSGVWL